jgi:hypothetical protein
MVEKSRFTVELRLVVESVMNLNTYLKTKYLNWPKENGFLWINLEVNAFALFVAPYV